jgi:hypothetical protein
MRVPAMPELVSAPPLLATAVLVLNDHLLKRRYPGVVTGKLSDLAGAFVMPLFVSAALAFVTRWPLRARLAVGVAATVGLLCAVKLSPWVASVVTAGLDALWLPLTGVHGRIVPDRTDLVALPFSVLAYAHGTRAGRPTGGQS